MSKPNRERISERNSELLKIQNNYQSFLGAFLHQILKNTPDCINNLVICIKKFMYMYVLVS